MGYEGKYYVGFLPSDIKQNYTFGALILESEKDCGVCVVFQQRKQSNLRKKVLVCVFCIFPELEPGCLALRLTDQDEA